ncbi:sensor histidine kinase [Nocardia sp. alder85J]|uniref:sensor histidine kinase n=1 Tax=Nocardia sp. alder85J TaxID=2862949 RepID=UPI001CD617B7|nr:CHASE3 domain-containing protein [Nocardia sp. alder85J]MCX4093880.1 CHASE3 domain-containing protein [Nocardia sp. alder85J]
MAVWARRQPGPWWRRITVQGWFVLVVALMALLVMIGTAVGAQMLARTAQVSDQLLQQIQPARTESYRLQAAVVDQETGVRGYAIAADRQFLQPYEQGRQDQDRAAARLRALVAGRDDLVTDLDAAQAAAAVWQHGYADPVIAAVTPGSPRAQDKTGTDAGKKSFDDVRASWVRLDADLGRAVTAGRADLTHTRAVRDVVLIGLVVVYLLTGLALVALVRVLVTGPMTGLASASRRVAGGDYDSRIPVRGPADLASVAEDVENMRQRMVEALAAVREQRDELSRQARELDARAAELQRSNGELEQFAYVASHDLQEPLRKVAAFCQMLEKRYNDKIDDRGRQYIFYAVDGAKRMQTLINDLLAFSRVGRVHDSRESVALTPVVTEAVANLAVALEDSGGRIDYPDDLPEVSGDPPALVMLWQNLLGNALKFRHADRSPVVTVERRPDEQPGMWLFTVSDNGIGIQPEFAEKVFVIFQRLHSRDAYTGTGVGLALCRKIVEYHGGKIRVDTDYPDGARLCFTLPVSTPATPDEDGAGGTDAADTVEGAHA